MPQDRILHGEHVDPLLRGHAVEGGVQAGDAGRTGARQSRLARSEQGHRRRQECLLDQPAAEARPRGAPEMTPIREHRLVRPADIVCLLPDREPGGRVRRIESEQDLVRAEGVKP